ncbi:organomercurial lyase [Halomarina salina]|uniref:Organomercurial lyase n=1 Tax=Halomarina salina TaxID=1872699 RepID=A0ABD5RT73_9EURY|nr:organomercurial lyase [Halomarina salina]
MSETDTQSHRIDEELQTHVARAFEFDDPPETFEAFWQQMMRTFADALDRGVTVEDLCTTDESPHWATVNGETRYYQCVTDAFLLGMYLDEDVTARTVSPVSETELVVEFDADGVVSAPDGAVLSFGVERSVDPPDGPVTPEAMYGRFCPYSKAFASYEEYEQWVAANPEVVSDVQPLDESLNLQARLVRDVEPFGDSTESRNASGGDCSC